MLVDAEGNAIGTAAKAMVHGPDTPLHLAFSSYVFDGQGRVLLTRRASHKITWPGVWTNSCCGHPLPGEPLPDAVIRRLSHELGLTVGGVDLLLPRFSYRAVMDNGIVEQELCPVYRVLVEADAAPNPDEVGRRALDAVEGVRRRGARAQLEISPWCGEQVRQLVGLGADPLGWPVADPADLPPAAR